MDGAGNPDLAPREPPETSATPGDKPAHRPPPPPAAAAPRNPYPTWPLTLMYGVIVSLVTIYAAYRARSDPLILAFVVSLYAIQLALFYFRKGRTRWVVFMSAGLLIFVSTCTLSSPIPFVVGLSFSLIFGPIFIDWDDLKSGSREEDGRGEPVSVVVHTGTDDLKSGSREEDGRGEPVSVVVHTVTDDLTLRICISL